MVKPSLLVVAVLGLVAAVPARADDRELALYVEQGRGQGNGADEARAALSRLGAAP